MTIYDLPALAKGCLQKATTPENISNGFKVAGIQPLNEDIFTDVDFAPSAVTDRPDPGNRPNETPCNEHMTYSEGTTTHTNTTDALI